MARNKEILAKRNKAIVEEHDLLYKIKRKRIDDVYQILAEKYFLTTNYIIRIIQENGEKDN